jgi:two-component system sensor histidine kinase MtrB
VRSPLRRVGLRVRLVATFALGTLLLCVLLATVSFTVTRSYLLNQRERAAEHQAQTHGAAIEEALRTKGTQVATALAGLRSTTDTQSLVRHAGRWYTSVVGVGPSELPAALQQRVVGGDGEHQRIKVAGSPVLVTGVPLAGGGQYYEIAPLHELDSTLRTLSTVLVFVAAGVTLCGAGLGLWTSRRLLQPLTTVAVTSREIAGGRLDARIGPTPDRQLSILSTAFNDMADALQDRIQRELRFTADVSHELRSPLTTVSAALGVLENRRNELSERGRRALDLLASEVGRFGQLVEDLLEISRIDAGAPVELEPVCLAQIVLRAQLLATVPLSVQIEVDSKAMPALMLGEKRRLERVIANLLDNAGRHGKSAVSVRLDVRSAPSADVLRLCVDDDGLGVPPQDRQRVFDRFARGSTGGRRGGGGGAGLGLALVREHVSLQHGRIWIEDAPMGGARFVVEFPQLPAPDGSSVELSGLASARSDPST